MTSTPTSNRGVRARLNARIGRMPYRRWLIIDGIITALFVILACFASDAPHWLIFTIAAVVSVGLAYRVIHDKLRW